MPTPPRDHPTESRDAHAWAAYSLARWRGRRTPPPACAIPERLLRTRGLAPLLFRALTRDADERAARVAPDYRHAATANLLRLAEGRRVSAAFEAAGLAPVLLKGGAFLARFAASDVGVRPMSDLDVLVGALCFEPARRCLAELGYHPVAARATLLPRLAHSSTFIRRDGPIDLEIDLHRAVAPWPQHPRLTQALVANAERCGDWRIPSIRDSLAHAAIHRANHGLDWSALDLLDVHCLAHAAHDDHGDFARYARTLGALPAVAAALAQSLHVFGDDLGSLQPRLDACVSQLGTRRWRSIAQLLPSHDPLAADPSGHRPLHRTAFVWPTLGDSLTRSVVSGAVYIPLRVVDRWRGRQDALRPPVPYSGTERA